MNIHLMPLTPSRSYNRDVAAYCRENPAVTAVHLSHLLCHHADELMNDPARAALNREIAALYLDQGCEVWAWTHEVHHPPAHLLDQDGKLKVDDDGLAVWLEQKYGRFLTETLPGLTGLVLTFAETQFTVYQDSRVVSVRPPRERTLELIRIMRRVCAQHGVRLVVRDFVYRVREVETMRETLSAMPDDVGIMSKIVPHDWHPYYPVNPLVGAFPGREQWVEHDLGHEYEGQHLYPYADLPQLASRIAAAKDAGSSTMCLRLDRYHGDTGQSAIHTPWGRRELETALGAAPGDVPAEEAELLSCATRVVNRMLFPARMWLADHSNLPDYGYAVTHLVGGNADRLPDWTGAQDDKAVAEALRTMNDTACDPPLSTRITAEMHEAHDALERCRQLLAHHEQTLAPYAAGVRSLSAWLKVWDAWREAFFALRRFEHTGTESNVDIQAAIDRAREAARACAPELGGRFIERKPAACGRGDPTPEGEQVPELPFSAAIQSLEERL